MLVCGYGHKQGAQTRDNRVDIMRGPRPLGGQKALRGFERPLSGPKAIRDAGTCYIHMLICGYGHVVRYTQYAGWQTQGVDGRVVFRNENIDNLIMKLERLYNVSITNNNQNLSSNFFNATIFVENETIEDVLNYLKEVYNINYQVVNNKIIIK